MNSSRSVRRRIAAAIATVSLVTGGVLVTTAPAQASVYDCGNGYACGWKDGGYWGSTIWKWTTSDSAFAAAPNDDISSISNNRTSSITWWTYENYWGAAWGQASGAVADLAGNVMYNDALSAVEF